ncbi:MAG: diacylglycerol/lipid kinase family protein [Lachnospiraceae bacterium]
MEIKRLLFIYNPKSGRGLITAYLPEILKIFDRAGYMITLYRTRYPGDGVAIVASEGTDYDLIVCAGGDGTLNGVVTGLMSVEPEQRPCVGFIPAGSTNDSRGNYNLPSNIPHAARIAVNGTPFATDVGTCNDKYFSYVTSFGKLSAVSCFTPQSAKNVLGRTAYLTEGIKVLMKMPTHSVKITHDGGEISGEYLLGVVTNALRVGGFANIMGRDVDLQDGIFEIMLIKRPEDLAEFYMEIEAVLLSDNNTHPAIEEGLVTRFKSSRLTFESNEDLQWVVDGEDAGRHKRVDVTNINRAVRIMTGPVKKIQTMVLRDID